MFGRLPERLQILSDTPPNLNSPGEINPQPVPSGVNPGNPGELALAQSLTRSGMPSFNTQVTIPAVTPRVSQSNTGGGILPVDSPVSAPVTTPGGLVVGDTGNQVFTPTNTIVTPTDVGTANTFAGANVLTVNPGEDISQTQNFLSPGEPPANDALATNTQTSRLLGGLPTVVSGRPLSSPIPLPPPSLNEAIYGPIAPNLLFGEGTIGASTTNENFIGPDTIQEASVRATCNATSTLAAILCDQYIRNPQGGVTGELGGNFIAEGCSGSRYGCCDNNITFKLNVEGSNCSRRDDFVCGRSIYGCCPGTKIKRANLIGTNCPQGAVPLVGWDENSSPEERKAAGVGYRDPKFFGNEQEFVAVLPGNILNDQQLQLAGIQPADRLQVEDVSRTQLPDGTVTGNVFRERARIPITPRGQQVNFSFGNNRGI